MIKICSLDLLKKEELQSDIYDSEGHVLVSSGEKITPELILKLYFKNIFVQEPLEEEEYPEQNISITNKGYEEEKEIVSVSAQAEPVVEEEVPADTTNLVLAQVEEVEEVSINTPDLTVSQVEEITEETLLQAQEIQIPAKDEDQEAKPSVTDLSIETTPADQKGPKKADSGLMDEELKEAAGTQKGPQIAGPAIIGADYDSSNPHLAKDFEAGQKLSEGKTPKGPVPSKFELDEEQESADESKIKSPQDTEAKEEVEEIIDLSLKFNESQAQKISSLCAKLGAIFGYSATESKKLQQAAYYCNIGITKFNIEDLHKKGFEKRKAYESYKIITEELNLPIEIAEAVKHHADDYDIATFNLNSQIPFQHIIGIASYYESLLMQNKTKEEALRKMLELGGNKFNTFVLHKFIRIMKESNE